MDADDAGIQQRWFAADLPDPIRLPGSLQSQGYGNDPAVDTKWTGDIIDRSWFDDPQYAKYRQDGNVKVTFWLQPDKHYVGPAWYQRTIDVPAGFADRRVVLHLERPHWSTQVWLDDRECGRGDSLSTPHEFDLTGATPGPHRLTIRVDNRLHVDVGPNSHSVSDHTQTNWNGIVGRIALRSEPLQVHLDDVQVFPDLKNNSVRLVDRGQHAFGPRCGSPIHGLGRLRRPSGRHRWRSPSDWSRERACSASAESMRWARARSDGTNSRRTCTS